MTVPERVNRKREAELDGSHNFDAATLDALATLDPEVARFLTQEIYYHKDGRPTVPRWVIVELIESKDVVGARVVFQQRLPPIETLRRGDLCDRDALHTNYQVCFHFLTDAIKQLGFMKEHKLLRKDFSHPHPKHAEKLPRPTDDPEGRHFVEFPPVSEDANKALDTLIRQYVQSNQLDFNVGDIQALQHTIKSLALWDGDNFYLPLTKIHSTILNWNRPGKLVDPAYAESVRQTETQGDILLLRLALRYIFAGAVRSDVGFRKRK